MAEHFKLRGSGKREKWEGVACALVRIGRAAMLIGLDHAVSVIQAMTFWLERAVDENRRTGKETEVLERTIETCDTRIVVNSHTGQKRRRSAGCMEV